MLAPPEGRAKERAAGVDQQIELSAEGVWPDVAARLREALNDTTFQTWFGEVAGATVDGDSLVITVPNDFTREWIEGHLLDLIRAAARDAAGEIGRAACRERGEISVVA